MRKSLPQIYQFKTGKKISFQFSKKIHLKEQDQSCTKVGSTFLRPIQRTINNLLSNRSLLVQ